MTSLVKPVETFVRPSVRCQHCQSPKAPRPLGRRQWNLARMFNGSVVETSRKRNFEFRPLRRAGEMTGHRSRAGCLFRTMFTWCRYSGQTHVQKRNVQTAKPLPGQLAWFESTQPPALEKISNKIPPFSSNLDVSGGQNPAAQQVASGLQPIAARPHALSPQRSKHGSIWQWRI